MKTVGIFDAKTHFSELIADAAAGETTIVTKNGKPVAEIAPVRSDGRGTIRAAVERLRQHGQEVTERNGGAVDAATVRRWIAQGRRYE
ncbi:MAG TPA: type II toxin-antitoxin system prevent-host-death family antitoxin [Candidatus Lustribacter sp.]